MVARPRRRATVPSTVEPFMKVTCPVGVPPTRSEFLTVTVNVTGRPKIAGLGNADRIVLVR